MTATVKLSESAVFELIMAGLEAYAVKHEGQDSVTLETGAHLWGSINKRAPFKCNIQHVSVETSAKRSPSSVSLDPASLEIKKEIANVFGDNYAYIGTAHTHPYLYKDGYKAATIRKEKFYHPSRADHRCEIDEPQIHIGQKRFSVALVLTVLSMERANDRLDAIPEYSNLVEFSLGNVKFWLYAQVFEHKPVDNEAPDQIEAFEKFKLRHSDYEHYDTLPIPVDTWLETDIQFTTMMKAFGRLKIEFDEADYRSKEKAEKRPFVF